MRNPLWRGGTNLGGDFSWRLVGYYKYIIVNLGFTDGPSSPPLQPPHPPAINPPPPTEGGVCPKGVVKIVGLFVGILLRVAFLTLVERKILGFIQLRKGPNYVGIVGLIQPFSDGLKIVRKQTTLSSPGKTTTF
jgi:hypothetical protein